MSSWSDRPEAADDLRQAVADRDGEAVRRLLAEKHGDEYAKAVLDDLRRDLNGRSE